MGVVIPGWAEWPHLQFNYTAVYNVLQNDNVLSLMASAIGVGTVLKLGGLNIF